MDENPAPQNQNRPPQQMGRIAGLDGLRAIAVSAVLLFHSDLLWAQGGYLGVDLFFVISGFLISGIIAREVEQSGRLSFRNFYWRRAKRLLPAVLLLVFGLMVGCVWLAPDALNRLPKDALLSLAFLTNWHLLLDNVSYFETFGRPPLLKHLWSLAIEEQFYIVWAFLSAFGLRFLRRPHMALVAATLALLSAAWMAAKAVEIGYPLQNQDASRLYFGTDTHAFPLLMGAALGFAWQPVGHRTKPPAAWAMTLLGLFGMAGFVYLVHSAGEQTPWLYPWGFLLAGFASLLMIMSAADPVAPLGRWLDCAPLRWIGERSYGIYLWHWPVFILFEVDIPGLLLWRILATLLIAEISYRLIESPIRHGLLERIFQRLRTADTRWQGIGQASGVVLVCAALVAGPIWVFQTRQLSFTPEKREAMSADWPSGTASTAVLLPPEPLPAAIKPGLVTYESREVSAIGDSVLLGSSQTIRAALPEIDLHARVGWQVADFIRKADELKAQGKLREVVLIHLGTNGYVYESQLRQLMQSLQDRKRVIIIDCQVPRRWMLPNNQLFEQVLPEFSNAVMVRWSRLSEGARAYFVADRVHLTQTGQRAYLRGILEEGGLRAAPLPVGQPVAPPVPVVGSYLQHLVKPYDW